MAAKKRSARRRRANSEGTVYKDASGVWWAQLPPDAAGRRPRRKAASERDALVLLRQMHAERQSGRDLTRRSETVEELLADYLESVRPNLRPATVVSYEGAIANITRRIGRARIDRVDVHVIQRLAAELCREHGVTAARHALGRLRAAFERVIPERVTRNPVDWRRLTLARHQTAERRPLEPRELARLLCAGDDQRELGAYARYGAAWWLLGLLGLRVGEVCGLAWRDLDWERGELHIRQQVIRAADGQITVARLKTPAAVRTLPLGPRLLDRLRQHWHEQQHERQFRGAAWKEHGHILAREDGRPATPHTLSRPLRRAVEAAGLRHVHPHLLRHGAATMIADAGYSEAVIAAILGHTRGGSVTRQYTHARREAIRNAVLAVEAAVLGQAAEEREAAP